MPQMAPMSWIFLPLFFIFVYLLMMSKIFFFSSFIMKSSKEFKPSTTMSTWMW